MNLKNVTVKKNVDLYNDYILRSRRIKFWYQKIEAITMRNQRFELNKDQIKSKIDELLEEQFAIYDEAKETIKLVVRKEPSLNFA